MSPRMLIELPQGNKIYFGAAEPERGLREVARTAKIPTASVEKFQAALGSLGTLVAALEAAVGGMARRPDKVEIELGASLTGECDLWVVSGNATADFKVTLAWDRPQAAAPG